MQKKEYRTEIAREMKQELENNLLSPAIEAVKLPEKLEDLPLITLAVIKSPLPNVKQEPKAFLSQHTEIVAS